MLSCLQIWKVNHVRRHFNGAGHSFAKEAFSLIVKQGLIEEVSHYILDIIYVEHCA